MSVMSKDKSKKKSSQPAKKKAPSKPTHPAYNDEDYESYKPKIASSRRRQQSGEAALNEVLSQIVDMCIA